jgi:hypothetical protein
MTFFCGTIEVYDKGEIVYKGPSFVRCTEYTCQKMVTNGYLEAHGHCYCGGVRFKDALGLLPEEVEGLREGRYLLNDWEKEFIWGEIGECQKDS